MQGKRSSQVIVCQLSSAISGGSRVRGTSGSARPGRPQTAHTSPAAWPASARWQLHSSMRNPPLLAALAAGSIRRLPTGSRQEWVGMEDLSHVDDDMPGRGKGKAGGCQGASSKHVKMRTQVELAPLLWSWKAEKQLR
jgi:hypothetical protein